MHGSYAIGICRVHGRCPEICRISTRSPAAVCLQKPRPAERGKTNSSVCPFRSLATSAVRGACAWRMYNMSYTFSGKHYDQCILSKGSTRTLVHYYKNSSALHGDLWPTWRVLDPESQLPGHTQSRYYTGFENYQHPFDVHVKFVVL